MVRYANNNWFCSLFFVLYNVRQIMIVVLVKVTVILLVQESCKVENTALENSVKEIIKLF